MTMPKLKIYVLSETHEEFRCYCEQHARRIGIDAFRITNTSQTCGLSLRPSQVMISVTYLTNGGDRLLYAALLDRVRVPE